MIIKAGNESMENAIALGKMLEYLGADNRPIETLNDLITATNKTTDDRATLLWWRGQSKSSWHLIPGVYRKNGGYRYEQNITTRFTSQALTRREKCPQTGDWPAWLFLMQHYRLRTRLLDWTQSPLIALFFAVNDFPNEPASLWVLNPYTLNENQLGKGEIIVPGDEESNQYFAPPFKSSLQNEKTVAVLPVEIDIRMMVQLSAFTIHGGPVPLDKNPHREDFLHRYDIPASAKETLRAELDRVGIRESIIFPDLEHLSKELNSMKFYSLDEYA